MENKRIQELISKFNSQQLNAQEQKEMEQLIETGAIDLRDLKSINHFDDKLNKLDFPSPSTAIDDRFYQMLALEKRAAKPVLWTSAFQWNNLLPKLAFALGVLIVGILIGYIAKPNQADHQVIQALSQQVTDLKEMMMLSLLEKESATERLKAVSLTQEMNTVSNKVTEALLKTLNQDENVNVRLAALDALKLYVGDSHVREQLIHSIQEQKSPLVQIALAELMVEIQEKSSVKELEKILKSEKTPNEVKNKIKESIKILI